MDIFRVCQCSSEAAPVLAGGAVRLPRDRGAAHLPQHRRLHVLLHTDPDPGLVLQTVPSEGS